MVDTFKIDYIYSSKLAVFNYLYSIMLFLKKEKLLLLVNPTNYAAKIFIVIYILSTSTIFAQQVEQFTIVRENAVSLNPAYTGAQGYMHGNATYRNQYSKITDAPYTAFANFEYQFQEKNFGLGGMFVHDQTGPTGRTGGTIMASYQLRLNQHETMNLDHECSKVSPYRINDGRCNHSGS